MNRRWGRACSLLALVSVTGAWGFDVPREVKERFDIRLPAAEADRGGFVLRHPTSRQISEAALAQSQVPGLTWRWDGMSGAPRWIAPPPGLALAPASGLKPEEEARRFLAARPGWLGIKTEEIGALEVTGVVVAREGDAHVHFRQRSRGLEVFQGGAIVNFEPGGAVLSVGAHLFSGVDDTPREPVFSALEAIRVAARDVYPAKPAPASLISEAEGGERKTLAEQDGFGFPPSARLVIFPLREGARLAWEVRISEMTRETDYRVLVDAHDGRLLFRENRTLYAEARVLQSGSPKPHTEEFAPGQYLLTPFPASTAQSPNGWIQEPGSLLGNNAVSHLGYFTAGGLADPAGSYDYPFGTPQSALTNAWWWVNETHDRLYAAGFDEAAGNFQMDNFGLGGVDADPMQVTHFARGGRNNAFNTTDPDGMAGTVNFFWVDCRSCGDHDGFPETAGERASGFMRDVVVHEYVHGLTQRMVGGPAAADCLYGTQSGGMGEGWSDTVAASFHDDPQVGGYFFEGLGWMRDLRHDLTYSDLCKVSGNQCQVHADGMIWAATLWDLRRSLVELYPADGLEKFHRLLVKGLANTVCYPDFLDARDGILNADTILYGSAHHPVIWNVFARRKMGSTASSTGENDTLPVTSTAVPAGMTCLPPVAPSGLVAAPDGPNAIRLDFTATGAAAVEVYREEVGNSFDTRVRIGSTTSASFYSDTTVQGGKGYRYHVAALGSAGITCKSADSATAEATATGTCAAYPIFDPSLAIADGNSSCALTLTWSAAVEGCPLGPDYS